MIQLDKDMIFHQTRVKVYLFDDIRKYVNILFL